MCFALFGFLLITGKYKSLRNSVASAIFKNSLHRKLSLSTFVLNFTQRGENFFKQGNTFLLHVKSDKKLISA